MSQSPSVARTGRTNQEAYGEPEGTKCHCQRKVRYPGVGCVHLSDMARSSYCKCCMLEGNLRKSLPVTPDGGLLSLQEPSREYDGKTQANRIHHRRGTGLDSGNMTDRRNGILYDRQHNVDKCGEIMDSFRDYVTRRHREDAPPHRDRRGTAGLSIISIQEMTLLD